MYDLPSVIEQLRKDESDSRSVEAKSAQGGVPSSIATTLSAFANTPGGGDILLGIDENSGFKSVRVDPSALKKAIVSIARQSVSPPLSLEFEDVDFEGERVLVVRVSELALTNKPCIVRRTGKAYLRSWDGDFELSELEIQGLLINRTQPRFDTEEVQAANRSDLSAELVRDYLALARATDRGLARISDDDELLRKTGVISSNNIPTLAGLVSLGSYPQQWFPNFVIQASAAPEPGDSPDVRIGDTARFSGPIPQMIDDVLAWVATHSRHQIVDSPDGRVRDRFDFPPTAIRELLSNALVHRDIGEWAWSRAVELRIDAKQLTLINPGGLYGLTVSRLFSNQLTSARNVTLMRICQHVKLRDGRVVEALATGIPQIMKATVGDGLPAPKFFDQGITFTAILTRPSVRLALTSSAAEVQHADRPTVTPTEAMILEALDAPRSQGELTAALGLASQSIRKHLRNLAKKGWVEMIGGKGLPATRYRKIE
jgi:ATP-dependent DNA helicase RecG